MHPVLRNILAVLAGIVAGWIVNMGLIMLTAKLMPPPAGVDVNDIASINAHIHEYSFAQLLMPFLAHALGTFAAGFVVARFAASRQLVLALALGVFFLLGGIAAVSMIPNAPLWFDVLDLVVAYLPMAWLGARLGFK
ncbi:MAG: hypothetical protein H6596_10245 [Flavobacteriales bacterium]|nr:hypothetical protein [Flavobacteriales bacterium]MCB9200854.1 hypothetical protein [Flavobacteriales bacterium]